MLPFRFYRGIWETVENQIQKKHTEVATQYRWTKKRALQSPTESWNPYYEQNESLLTEAV